MDTQIEYHGPTDTHGRCHFSLRWIDDYFPGHPEGEHVRRDRGQHFHADPRKYGHLRPEEKEICRCSFLYAPSEKEA